MENKVLVEVLFNAVPEFKSKYLEQNNNIIEYDNIYTIYGDFALFINREINKSKIDEKLIERCYTVLNELGNSDSKKVINLLVVGVLEILTDDENLQIFSFKLLKGSSKELYQDFFDKGLFNKLV